MITGQTHVIRYYPMYDRSFSIMKRLIPEQCHIEEDSKRDVEGMFSFFLSFECFFI